MRLRRRLAHQRREGASIEIACGRIVVRINGSVDRETLRTVLAAVQRG